jgi:spore coat protein E
MGGKTMADIKKIITRAVYGRRIQTFRNISKLATETENPVDVLGCIISESKILSSFIERDNERGKQVRANVKSDIHVWYRIGRDTRISKISAEFSDIIEVAQQGTESFSHEEVNVWIKEKPKCVDAIVAEGNLIIVQLEYALEAEIIGETTLTVKVFET